MSSTVRTLVADAAREVRIYRAALKQPGSTRLSFLALLAHALGERPSLPSSDDSSPANPNPILQSNLVLSPSLPEAAQLRAARALAGWQLRTALLGQHAGGAASLSSRSSHAPPTPQPRAPLPPLRVGPSTIGPHSGNGLFASRDIRAGELVAIYPGALYAGQALPPPEAYLDGWSGAGGVSDGGAAAEDVLRELGVGIEEKEEDEKEKDDKEEARGGGEKAGGGGGGSAASSPGAFSTTSSAMTPPRSSAYKLMRPDGVRCDAGDVAAGEGLAALLASHPWAVAHIAQHPPGPGHPAHAPPSVIELTLLVSVLRDGDGECTDGGRRAALAMCGSASEALAVAASSARHAHPLTRLLSLVPRPWFPESMAHLLPYWWPPSPVLSGPIPSVAVPAPPLALTASDASRVVSGTGTWERARTALALALSQHDAREDRLEEEEATRKANDEREGREAGGGGGGGGAGDNVQRPGEKRKGWGRIVDLLADRFELERAAEREAHEHLAVSIVPATVFVATRPLREGEEVFFDYGFMTEGNDGNDEEVEEKGARGGDASMPARKATSRKAHSPSRSRAPSWYVPVDLGEIPRQERALEEQLRRRLMR